MAYRRAFSQIIPGARRSFCSKEELWKILHPLPETTKQSHQLWQTLHPLPSLYTLDAKQEVFKPKDEWRHYHPLVETTRVPHHHIERSGGLSGAVSKPSVSHAGWSLAHATPGAELWRNMHPVDGITFRPRNRK